MSNPVTNLAEKEAQLPSNFTFSLTCPKCQSLLTPQDFDQNHFTIAHLQSYFQQKEKNEKAVSERQELLRGVAE